MFKRLYIWDLLISDVSCFVFTAFNIFNEVYMPSVENSTQMT